MPSDRLRELVKEIGPFQFELLAREECERRVNDFVARFSAGRFARIMALDASDLEPDAISTWLLATGIQGLITVVWAADREGIRIDFQLFTEHYDDLWYPSSDDVLIWDASERQVLDLDHEEVFTLLQAD